MRGGDVPDFVTGTAQFIYKLTLPFTKFIWRKAVKVTANSENLSLMANKIAPEIDIEMIPNGIDIKSYNLNKGDIAKING